MIQKSIFVVRVKSIDVVRVRGDVHGSYLGMVRAVSARGDGVSLATRPPRAGVLYEWQRKADL